VLLAALALGGCTIEEPSLPTFSTHLAVPLGTQDVTVAEILDDHGDYLAARPDSSLAFDVRGDTTVVELDVDLTADVAGTEFATEIGEITLDAVSGATVGFSLVDLYPDAADLPSTPVDVPPFTFDDTSDPTSLGELESAHVSSGVLEVTLTNGLAVPVSGDAPPELLTLQLLAAGDGRLVGEVSFPTPIASGASATGVMDLAGADLPGDVRFRVAGGSAGADGVVVDPAAELTVTVTPRDIVVDAATAVIGAQGFASRSGIALPDSVGIIAAELTGGVLELTTTNELPIPCTATVRFDEITTADGDTLVVPIELAAGASTRTTVPLAGCRIAATDGAPLDSLTVRTEVVSPGSDGAMVTITSGSRIGAVVAPTTLAFGEITGRIPEQVFPLDPVVETIDLPEELDGLTLPEATLAIDIVNRTGIDGLLDFTLTAINARGETTVLSAAAEIAADRSGGTRTTIVLDQGNSNIAELLSSLPQELSFAGRLSVGGDDRIGTIRPGDSALVSWRVAAPVRVVIADGTEINHHPERIAIDADVRDDIDRHVVAGELVADVDNHFPFGVGIRLLVGPDSLGTLTAPELVIGPLDVAEGDVDPATGTTVAARRTRLVVPLDHDQIRAFLRPDAHLAVAALLPGSGGQAVALRLGDGVTVTGAVRVELLVEEDQ